MPKFRIEQYELHAMTYTVEADTKAAAIKKLFDGEENADNGDLEYIEIAEDYGMPIDENLELANELRLLGVDVGQDVIPSIRSIEKVGEEDIPKFDMAKANAALLLISEMPTSIPLPYPYDPHYES